MRHLIISVLNFYHNHGGFGTIDERGNYSRPCWIDPEIVFKRSTVRVSLEWSTEGNSMFHLHNVEVIVSVVVVTFARCTPCLNPPPPPPPPSPTNINVCCAAKEPQKKTWLCAEKKFWQAGDRFSFDMQRFWREPFIRLILIKTDYI